MAINFTISYTFSPGTTISSSQVNTNFSDNAAVWQGLEAGTKSFAVLNVDADPTISTQVARKSYVDHYSAWRRPNLTFASTTTVSIESGLDGTSGNIPMLFPDGSMRTETSTTRTTFNITRNAVLVTSGAQSGLTGATSEANNTWYALYAVKVTDSSTLWVTVGTTVVPIQANFATLNTAYGTNGWVYLGLIRNGDNSGAAADILNFIQNGNQTSFRNTTAGSQVNGSGIALATTAGATSLTYSISTGTGAAQIPNNVQLGTFEGVCQNGSGVTTFSSSDGAVTYREGTGTNREGVLYTGAPTSQGLKIVNGSSIRMDIFLMGFVDFVLGVGSNPLL